MDPVERMGIIRSVRALLVRNYIDLGRLVIQVSPGTVHLRGSLQRLLGTSPLSPESLQAIVQDIRRIPGVHRVITEFDNWTFRTESSTWTQAHRATPTPSSPESKLSQPLVHNLDDPEPLTPDGQ